MNEMNRLYFDKNVFRILVFSDLHYGENTEQDYQSDMFQYNILNIENPDFVVFNGDMSSDYAAQGDKWNWWITQWNRYTYAVRQKHIPYALNIGNHDMVMNDAMSIWQYDALHGHPYSHTRIDPVQSIPIYVNDTPQSQETGQSVTLTS